MGINTGAYKSYTIKETNEVLFHDYYSDLENEALKYPNGEFIELADCLHELTDGIIDIQAHLIWDKIDYENAADDHTFHQIKGFSFKTALVEGLKAKTFIDEHVAEVKKQYVYNIDAHMVIDELLKLWQKGYYITYDY